MHNFIFGNSIEKPASILLPNNPQKYRVAGTDNPQFEVAITNTGLFIRKIGEQEWNFIEWELAYFNCDETTNNINNK